MPACKCSSKVIPAVFAWTVLICCSAIFFACAYVYLFVQCSRTVCICTLLECLTVCRFSVMSSDLNTSSESRYALTNPYLVAVALYIYILYFVDAVCVLSCQPAVTEPANSTMPSAVRVRVRVTGMGKM